MRKHIVILLVILYSPGASSKDTVWELGAGLTGINLPLYPGSAENKNYLIPFPYLRVKSKYFEINEGVRGFFYQSPDFRFNISADLGVPVSSDDSSKRNGMPDLNTVIQIGPSMEFIFAGGRKQPFEFRLELPVRTAIASDLRNTDNIGWIAEPRITYETLRPFKTGWAYLVSSGLRYATKDYHQYYYDVPSAFTTVNRPFFEADKGYSGLFVDMVGNWREEDFIYFAFIRYQNLNNTAFEDSPLVEDNNYVSVGLGMVWIFAGSL